MKVLIIVVSFNGEKFIQNCFDSLIISSINTDTVNIDNNSTDTTKKIINERFPFVKIIENKQNFGFGHANNIGLKYALENNYDYIFLLNQDAYVQQNTIERLIMVSQKYPEYGILSPIHLNGLGDKLDSNFSNYINEKTCPSLVSDFILKKDIKDIYSLDFVNAAAWLLPIETLKTVGGFDPLFFHYGEDNNYCQRLLYHGLKVGIVPDSFIYHDRCQVFKSIDRYDNKINFERSVNIKCADINLSFRKSINWELKELKRRIIISFLSFNIKGFLKWMKFYFHLSSSIPQIKRSREVNMVKDTNYLNE